MGSWYQDLNNRTMNLEQVEKDLKNEHPGDEILHSSGGTLMIHGSRDSSVPFFRTFKTFPGSILITDKRMYFKNPKSSGYNILTMINVFLASVLFLMMTGVSIPFYLMGIMGLWPCLIPGILFTFLSAGMLLMIPLHLYRIYPRTIECLFDDVFEIGIFNYQFSFTKAKRIWIYDGSRSLHFILSEAPSSEVEEFIQKKTGKKFGL